METRVRARSHESTDARDTRERRRDVRQVAFFCFQRGPAPYNRRSAMHRSKLDIGGADAGAGGMSIGSDSGGASGMSASSSSSDASAVVHSTGSSGAGSCSICLANYAPVRAARWPLRRPRGIQRRSVRAIDAIPCCRPRPRRHALLMAKPSKVPSRTERARVALACAWMQLLKLRKTATSQGCKNDVLRGEVWRPGWPRWRECWPCAREGSTMVLLCSGSARCPGLLRQDGVCLARVHDLHQHIKRATVHAEGDRECRGLLCVAL